MASAGDGRLTRRQVIQGAAAAAAGLSAAAGADAGGRTTRLAPVPIEHVVLDDAFWSPKLGVWRAVTIPDCFGKFETELGDAFGNFDLVRDGKIGKHAGPPWYDGLVYETITGTADFLAARRDPALVARIDAYITRIAAAQAADPRGYLNTYTSTSRPQSQRWGMNGGDDRWQHDVYNAGMLVEAGVHYFRATGKPELLRVAARLADLMCDTIGPPPRANVVPGHSGPEAALIDLASLVHTSPAAARVVGGAGKARRYTALACFFIDARGRHEGRTSHERSFGEYGQDHAPLAEQTELVGHAVRAALFGAGVAAAAGATGHAEYRDAALRLWNSLVDRKMYITGAAGAVADDEKLGPDYVLPNDGYMETCAAVALAFFGREMYLLNGEARFVDEVERALYNAVPGGVSLSGDRYYYQNPLTGEGLRRWAWHDCPCCPPMLLKAVGAMPGWVYAQAGREVRVDLFVGSQATLAVGGCAVTLRQVTDYPWDGRVRIEVEPERPTAFDLCLRLPGWARPSAANNLYRSDPDPAATAPAVMVGGRRVKDLEVERAYARLRRRWKSGDVVTLDLPMPVRRVRAHPSVEADRGLVAFTRGPIVYCAEGADHPEGIRHLAVPRGPHPAPVRRPDLLGGVVALRATAAARVAGSEGAHTEDAPLTLVPFYASANREPGSLRVWLPEDPAAVPPATLAMRSRPSASHCWHLDSVGAVNDGVVPASSADTGRPRLSWWPHKGTAEWLELALPAPARVSRMRAFWFADRPAGGGCDLPGSWRLLWRSGDGWQPVTGVTSYEVAPDRYCEVTFDPVEASEFRLEVQLQPEWSAGVCEVEME